MAQKLGKAKMMSAAASNITGLVMNLVGVLMLFRYGMPYRIRTEGAGFLKLMQRDVADQQQETAYDYIGWLAVAFVVIGTALQIYASTLP